MALSSAKVGGAFKSLVSGSAVKVSGVWKDITDGYVKVGGVWKRFFTVGVVSVSGEPIATVTTTPTGAQSRATFKTDGTVTKTEAGVETQIDALTDWIIPNSAANPAYEIRYTGFSGDGVVSSLTEDVWDTIDVDRSITLTRIGSSVGTSTCSFTIEIRLDGGPVLDSALYSLTSTVDP